MLGAKANLAALRESGRAADAAKLPGAPTTAASQSSTSIPP
jgi:hypothetical protein